MKLGPGGPHLTYCTNIHPGESWAEVRRNLEHHVVAVRDQIAPDRRFGVGLRLSARAAEELSAPGETERLHAWLHARGMYVFTLNGFPYGTFHGTRIKEEVYRPDWLEEERLAYTNRLASLLAALLPDEDGMEGTVSTVPGAFAARVGGEQEAAAMAERMVRHVAELHRIRAETGRDVVLALEPEPCCYLEAVSDTAAFFERHLFAPASVDLLASRTGLPRGEAEAFLRRHLGVCVDTCHMAVEWEDPGAALAAFAQAGIRVAKVQLSAGVHAALGGPEEPAVLEALERFAEGTYLHQTVERHDGVLRRYLDLPEMLAEARRAAGRRRECRVHFHVPLFREDLGPFRSTQAELCRWIELLRAAPSVPHLEVETYTWDVLPAEHRGEHVETAIARELQWVLQRFQA